MMAGMDTDLFADSYAGARQRFLSAASRASASLPAIVQDTFPCPATGPDGDSLFTDIAWLGPHTADKVLVLQSATHGVEGYAGSAIQCQWLQNLTTLPADTAVLLVHALNPWGMAWHRRCDQDGIDLNRNFIDFSQPLPSNPGYKQLRDVLFDSDADTRRAHLEDYLASHGREALEVALSGGQYLDPHGPFFGGSQPAHANSLVHDWIDRFALSRKQLAVIDLHTGLGPFGEGEIICDHAPGSAGVITARRWYGDEVALPLEGTSSSVPKLGLIDFAWHAIMANNSCFVTLEFGTFATDALFEVLLEDHRQWASGQRDAACVAAMRHHFCPDDRHWRDQVLRRGADVIARALDGLAES
jgi:predicted deacylase